MDSRPETLKHIERVDEIISVICDDLKQRAQNHDKSKLESFEKPYVDEYMELLKTIRFGSEEYKK